MMAVAFTIHQANFRPMYKNKPNIRISIILI